MQYIDYAFTKKILILFSGISIYVVTQRAHDFNCAHYTKLFGSIAIDRTIEKFLDDFASEHLNPELQVARDKFDQTVCIRIYVQYFW